MSSPGSYEWALTWEYSGLFDKEDAPPLVGETSHILAMWRALEEAYAVPTFEGTLM